MYASPVPDKVMCVTAKQWYKYNDMKDICAQLALLTDTHLLFLAIYYQ